MQYDIILSQENAGGSFNEARLTGIAEGNFFTTNASGLPVARAIATTDITGLDAALASYILATEKAVANGVATLDANGKVLTSQLPASIVGAVQYQGVWDAATNTPTIPAASSSNTGNYYKVSVAGTTVVDGISDWQIGDWIISDGTTWDKVDNSELVTAVAGKVGNVTLDKTDVGLANVTNDAQLKIASNLSDLADVTAARTNLGLGGAAILNVGTTAGTVAAGDDGRIPTTDEKAALVGTEGTPSTANKFVTETDARLTDKRLTAFVSAPASATSTGIVGQEAYDSNYHYICVAANTWKRNAVASWS